MRINGNLTLNTGGSSEVQNLVIERLVVSSFPSVVSAEKGRILFGTDTNSYYYNNGTVWMTFATGGNATALQTEVDNLEASLGAIINADGTFASSAFASYPFIASATSVTNAIEILAGQINTDTYLYNLLDVSIGSRTTNQFLQYNAAGKWENHTLIVADLSDATTSASELNQLHTAGATTADFVKLHAVTATAANINILTSTTVTSTTLNYIDTLTSNAQDQLDNKQPLDAQLTSIALLTPSATSQFLLGGTGGVYSIQDAAGYRAALGVSYTDVQPYDLDLVTMAGFAPAADSSESTTINGVLTTHTGINDIIVGTGTQTEGSRWTLERGASARTSLGLGNIAILDEHSFIRADAATGSNIAVDISFNNNKITNLAPGAAGTDAINLNQLEAYVTGLSWKQAVIAATTANVDLTTGGLLTIDGYALTAGARVLVKNQTLPAQNGIYLAASGAWTRTTDFDAMADNVNAAAVFVNHGAQANTGWVVNSTITTFGTDPIAWVQFNGTAGITAGTGLAMTGNTIDVNLGAGIAQLPTDEVGIDLYSSSEALILTTDGSTRSTDTAAKLHILLDLAGNGKLIQSVAGLKVTTNTITEAELTASVAGDGLVGGNGTALAVVSHVGTGAVGGDLSTGSDWDGVGLTTVTADSVGVTLGSSSSTAAPGNHTHKAAVITYSNTTSLLLATNVQGAIDELDGRVDTIEANAGNLLTEVNAIETSLGSVVTTAGAFNVGALSGTNYLTAASSVTNVITTLDTQVHTVDAKLVAAINKMYYVGTMASSTTWTVTHSLNQKYVNVTIVDAADNVIIPQSIVMTDASTVTVTFNVAVAGKAIIMGLASGLIVSA